MIRLAAYRPAGVQRWQDELFVKILEYFRDAGGQVVVEQDRAGVEAVEAQTVLAADQRFEK